MRHLRILYIGMKDGLDVYSMEISLYLRQVLSACSELHLFGDLFTEQTYREDGRYALVVQNSFCLIRYKDLFKWLSDTPVLFVSCGNRVVDYVTPFKKPVWGHSFGKCFLVGLGHPGRDAASSLLSGGKVG